MIFLIPKSRYGILFDLFEWFSVISEHMWITNRPKLCGFLIITIKNVIRDNSKLYKMKKSDHCSMNIAYQPNNSIQIRSCFLTTLEKVDWIELIVDLILYSFSWWLWSETLVHFPIEPRYIYLMSLLNIMIAQFTKISCWCFSNE